MASGVLECRQRVAVEFDSRIPARENLGSSAESVGRNGSEFELWNLPGWVPALGKPGFPQIPQLRRRPLDSR